MSNYLTRAAARAAPETVPAVRPRLHSPYEGIAAPSPFAAEREVESPVSSGNFQSPGPIEPHYHFAAAPPDALPPAAPVTIIHPILREVHHHASVIGHPHDAPAPNSTSTAPLAPQVSILPIAAPLLAAPDRPAPAASVIGPHSASMESLPTASPAAAAPSPPAPARAAAPPGLPLLENPAPAPRRDSSPSAVTPPAAIVKSFPTPLLASPRAALPQPALPAQAAAEQRTVNITIGRLEIRAATSAPERPRSPQPTGRGPLALDEFLRGKSPRRHS